MADHRAPSNNFWATITSPEARKAQVAIAGVLLSLVSAGLIPPDIGIWITTIITALVAAGVFTVPNAIPVTETAPEPKPVVEEFHRGDVRG